jgi:hypothetical protein
MTEARRTLGRWLLAAFLERGCDPTTLRIPQPLRRERPLTACELAALTAPLARIVRLRGRGGAEEDREEDIERVRSWVGRKSGTGLIGPREARVIAFPARSA